MTVDNAKDAVQGLPKGSERVRAFHPHRSMTRGRTTSSLATVELKDRSCCTFNGLQRSPIVWMVTTSEDSRPVPEKPIRGTFYGMERSKPNKKIFPLSRSVFLSRFSKSDGMTESMKLIRGLQHQGDTMSTSASYRVLGGTKTSKYSSATALSRSRLGPSE